MTFLVAINSNESGLEVRTLFPESQWPIHELEPQIRFIPGYSLSSECGDQYYQCQEQVLVINNISYVVDHSVTVSGRSFSIVFVPLETGLLLLSFWYNSNAMTELLQWNVSVVNSSNCTPAVFYTIKGKFYMVCISSYEGYDVAVYKVQLNLNHSVIEFEGTPLAEQMHINIRISNSSSKISNFIIVEHKIFFAIESTIAVLDILDPNQTQQYPKLPNCNQIDKIVLTGDGARQLLAVYCIDRYIYFDPIYGDWTDTQLFSSNGVPYLCPDNNYKAISFFIDNTLQFLVKDIPTHTISANISSGVCFESQTKTYFAYSDQRQDNVYLYDFITQNIVSPRNVICSHLHRNCPQLMILGNQYLLIRDSHHALVLDTTNNFSLIINISSDTADILAVLHIDNNIHSISAVTPSPPTTPSTTTESAASSTNNIVSPASTLIRTPSYTHTPTQSSSIISTSAVHNSTSITATTISPGTAAVHV